MPKTEPNIGPFPFMQNKAHDMVVVIRLTGDQPANLRRFTVYYKLINLIASFEHDVTDAKYRGDYLEFSKDMFQKLIGEVKSRVVARQDFTVWFYSKADMEHVLAEVCKVTQANAGLRKIGESLTRVSAIIPAKK